MAEEKQQKKYIICFCGCKYEHQKYKQHIESQLHENRLKQILKKYPSLVIQIYEIERYFNTYLNYCKNKNNCNEIYEEILNNIKEIYEETFNYKNKEKYLNRNVCFDYFESYFQITEEEIFEELLKTHKRYQKSH